MADKKFGQKRVCPHCEKKFYDLNKKSPFKCFFCGKEIVIEEDLSVMQTTQPIQQPRKTEPKDEFADIENADNATTDDDGVISLDDAALEEEQDTKN
tara:strand:+ start:213 stop:503 length:291 start_codon:yes stop_codon:yes gene_type:complete